MNHLNRNNHLSPNKKLNLLVIAFLIAGVLVRLFHFFYNRSLWMDEVYLSTSLVKMNYLELATKPLYYQQKAPIGFLWLVKFFVNLGSNKELLLRVVPLLSGIASLFLFIPVAKYFLKDKGAALAIGIMCLSPALTYHSVEIKQYAAELFCAILSFYLFIRFKDKTAITSLFLWGIYGAIILWFSYSAIFILGGIGAGLSLQYLIQKKWRIFFISLLPFGLWLISFVVNYLLFTHKHAESAWIAYWFKAYDNFMPLPPKSVHDLVWFATNLYRMLDYPLGLLWNFMAFTSHQGLNMLLKMPFLPFLFLGMGICAFLKRGRSNLLVLLLPVLLMFLASGIQLYPLTERFWVFISPVFIILIAAGFDYCTEKIRSAAVKNLLFLLVILGPAYQSVYFLIKPGFFYSHKKSFQRETLMYINQNYQPGDAVYVYWNNLPGYRLYKQLYNFKYTAIEGSNQRAQSHNYEEYYRNLSGDFKQFANSKRVWLLYNTQFATDIGDKIDDPKWYYEKNASPTQHLVNELFKHYKPLKVIVTADVTLYLLEPK